MPISSSELKTAKSGWRRRAVLVVAVVFLVALTMDLARPPERQLSARALVMGVRAYQHIGHQLVPRGQCRFSPTCSSYAEVVIRERGALKGGWLTVRRLIKCGPWTPEGTKDPPPPVGSKSETP